jgi:hypothetical protein
MLCVHYGDCHLCEVRWTWSSYAGTFILSVIMLSVVMLSVVMLSVVASLVVDEEKIFNTCDQYYKTFLALFMPSAVYSLMIFTEVMPIVT